MSKVGTLNGKNNSGAVIPFLTPRRTLRIILWNYLRKWTGKRFSGRFNTQRLFMNMKSCRGWRSVSLAIAGLALVMVACEGGSANQFSSISINPGDRLVNILVDSDYVVTITNTGEGRNLEVTDVVLNYTPDSADESEQGAAFQLFKGGLPATLEPVSSNPSSKTTFTLRYQAPKDGKGRSATVTVRNNNTTNFQDQELVISFEGKKCRPVLDVESRVEFGFVSLGNDSYQDIGLVNTGTCDLVIDYIRLEGESVGHPEGFTVTIKGNDYVGKSDFEQRMLPEVVTIAPGSGVMWGALFAPVDTNAAGATLVIHTNNSEVEDGLYFVDLVANASGPKLVVDPNPIDFGGKLIQKTAGMMVNIRSTGDEPLVISQLALKDDTSADFRMEIQGLPAAPTAENPVTLENGQAIEVMMTFTPNDENPRDNDGKPIPDTGTLLVGNNGIEPNAEIPISGYGVTVDCPKPVIVVEEGELVKPQTLLHIHGEQSQSGSAGGSIIKYSWTVDQPDENKFILLPSASSPTVTHEVNIGGEYTYCLDVCDNQYCSSDPKCGGSVCKTVKVIPDKAIHCELTWHTPADTDEFDEGEDMGADMDLHFAHPFAAMTDIDKDGIRDPWFHVPYDVFWFQPNPEWETPNPDGKDNPSLDRDDTDGAGPENLNLDSPVPGRVYRIGVHYWDDHGFGASYPRLKCFIYGEEVFSVDMSVSGTAMYKCDMWYAAEIEWPQQTVTLLRNPDNSFKITKGYEEPSFSAIGGGGCE